MLSIASTMLITAARQAPAGVGDLIHTLAFDRERIFREGFDASLRDGMIRVETPAILASLVSHEPDDLSPDMPVTRSYAPVDGGFVITLSHFPGEGETDGYVVVSDPDRNDVAVLHTRSLGRRSFDAVDASKLSV